MLPLVFTPVIEDFPARAAFELAVELHEEVVTQRLFAQVRERGRTPFHHQRHVLDHLQDVPVRGNGRGVVSNNLEVTHLQSMHQQRIDP